ncbi:hypothetical protein [Burkholderia sp. LMG 21824]|uniref:hypothetical protein n=1 Tax=Burkholderia sp. LMG 21824 TaxID=3158172 RepID=UPI003C2FEA56
MSTTSSVAPSGDGATYACGRCDEISALTGAQPRRFAVLEVQLEFARQHMTSSAIMGG